MGTSTAAPVGGSVKATPASHAALQAALSSRVSLQRKHSAENVVMRDVYTVLATLVAHDRISKSNVTQVQVENLKSHQFTNRLAVR